MGVSVYPVLNKELPEFDVTGMSGKALAKAVFEEGSAFAVLQQFSSQSKEELADFILDQTGQEANGLELPAEEWFSPKEGLHALHSLLPGTATLPSGWSPDDFSKVSRLIYETWKMFCA